MLGLERAPMLPVALNANFQRAGLSLHKAPHRCASEQDTKEKGGKTRETGAKPAQTHLKFEHCLTKSF